MKALKKTGRWQSGLAMVAAAWLCGCDGGHDHAGGGGGGHRHDSVHGGVAVELGSHEYHLDFLHNSGEGVLKAWVMDAHAENFVRVTNATLGVRVTVGGAERDLELTAQANASTGEKVGETSQFEGRADWLKGVERFTGTIPAVEIRGRRYENLRFEYPAR